MDAGRVSGMGRSGVCTWGRTKVGTLGWERRSGRSGGGPVWNDRDGDPWGGGGEEVSVVLVRSWVAREGFGAHLFGWSLGAEGSVPTVPRRSSGTLPTPPADVRTPPGAHDPILESFLTRGWDGTGPWAPRLE